MNVLDKFTREHSRFDISTPFFQGMHTYATDTIIAIRVKELLGAREMQEPNMARMFSEEETCLQIEITPQLIVDITEYGFIKEECVECEGEGEVEWEYKTWSKYLECPECEGLGKIPTNQEGRQAKDVDVSIFGRRLSARRFYRLIELSEELEEPLLLTKIPEENKAIQFRVGKYQLIVMPLSQSENSITIKTKPYDI